MLLCFVVEVPCCDCSIFHIAPPIPIPTPHSPNPNPNPNPLTQIQQLIPSKCLWLNFPLMLPGKQGFEIVLQVAGHYCLVVLHVPMGKWLAWRTRGSSRKYGYDLRIRDLSLLLSLKVFSDLIQVCKSTCFFQRFYLGTYHNKNEQKKQKNVGTCLDEHSHTG